MLTPGCTWAAPCRFQVVPWPSCWILTISCARQTYPQLVDETWHVRVADFNLSRPVEDHRAASTVLMTNPR